MGYILNAIQDQTCYWKKSKENSVLKELFIYFYPPPPGSGCNQCLIGSVHKKKKKKNLDHSENVRQ